MDKYFYHKKNLYNNAATLSNTKHPHERQFHTKREKRRITDIKQEYNIVNIHKQGKYNKHPNLNK